MKEQIDYLATLEFKSRGKNVADEARIDFDNKYSVRVYDGGESGYAMHVHIRLRSKSECFYYHSVMFGHLSSEGINKSLRFIDSCNRDTPEKYVIWVLKNIEKSHGPIIRVSGFMI